MRDRSGTAHPARRIARRLQQSSAERDVREIYYEYFDDRRKERQLFSAGAFFVTFAATRAITHAIRAERGPFKNVQGPGGKHIHHMTFGIVGLLSVGYLWLLEVGVSEERRSSRITASFFGSGAALTLDEFALWLNLEDVYWAKQGRESIDAVVLFGSLLSLSVLGKGFLLELVRGRQSRTKARSRGRKGLARLRLRT